MSAAVKLHSERSVVLMEGDRIILFSQTEHSQKVMQYFKGRE